MSYPDYLDDMESQLASYLGEDPSTFFSNENQTASAPVDSVEESSYDTNGRFTWDDFLKEEGIETNSPPPATWEWNPTEADFYKNEIVAPPTVDETNPEEPAQSSRREEEAGTNVESGNTNGQLVATTSKPELQPEENTTIPNDDSLFGEDNSDKLVSPMPNTGNNSNVQSVAADDHPSNSLELEQEENIDNNDNDSLFGDSTPDDNGVPKINEEHQSKVVAQDANRTPEFVADRPKHGDNAASAPITPGADQNNTNADNENDSLFGEVDDSGLGDGSQPPQNESPRGDNAPTDNVDDLFGSEFGADFEAELAAELEAELKKDSTNAVAPAVQKHTELHFPKPPRRVAKSQGLHLPDPPRAIANPQGLHLPAPPRKSVASQGLQLPDPPRAVVNPQGLHLPEPPRAVASSQGLSLPAPPPRVVTGLQGLHLPSPPSATGTQQSEVDTSAPEQADSQEDETSNRRRRVRTSRIPRSDMSRPKGRGQAGKILTQLSGPAPSKLPEVAPSSSSGTDDAAERITRLPRWAFGKYTSFGKPVAGSRYQKPNNSANNPITVEEEPQSVEETKKVNPDNQNVAQPAPKIPDAIDLTSDTQGSLSAAGTVQDNPTFDHANGQESTRTYQNSQIPAFGNELEFIYGDDPLPNSRDELSFPPVMNDAGPALQLQANQSHTSAALDIVLPVAPQYGVPPRPAMEDFSLYGKDPLVFSYNSHPVQMPSVHVVGTVAYPYAMGQTDAHDYHPIPQPIQTGNYEQGSGYGLGDDMGQDTSAEIGGSSSSGLDNSRPKKRTSHECAEYADPRVLMTYGEFKQIFPQEQTRGCFEVAIQNEQAADAAIVARGGIPPQRPTIRKSIICTWSQVQHLNRIRAANGEKLFEPKRNAHKRPEAFKESLRRKRQERGEISESDESDTEPEAKRLRLAQEPTQMAPSLGEQYGERSSQIRSIKPDNPQVSADVSHLPPNDGALQGSVSQGRPGISLPQIHQSMSQSFKRKMDTEQWAGLDSVVQETVPTAKRPKLAISSGQHVEPTNNHSRMDGFQKYVSERQSEYLKLRVPELRELCKTRKVKHSNVNDLSKGGLVGVLVGQDVSRHPVYNQMHSQSQARFATNREHPIPAVSRMGGMNAPAVAVNRARQQIRAPDGLGMRQDPPRPNFDPFYAMGSSYRQQGSLLFRPTASHNADGLRVVGNGNTAQPSRNVGRAQQLPMSGNVRGLANSSGQPLVNTRQPPVISQPSHVSMANRDRGNLYAQSRLPVSTHNNGYNNSGIHQDINGGRNSHAGANAQIPAYGIAGDFGTGIYQPAVDDRRRKPRIVGQDAPRRVPRGNQRSLTQSVVNVPQPAMNNSARQYTSTQQPMVGSASGNIEMGHQSNTLGGSQIPRPVHHGNVGGDPRRFVQNHPQGGLYSAPMQGLSWGAQQHGAAQSSRPPYYGLP